MNLKEFDLNLLVDLDALLTEKNVTHAGIRVNLSQSAMSGALAKLRNRFRDPLLQPVGRKMELTPLARSLVKPVRDLLLQAQATITAEFTFDPATSKRCFSIALSEYAFSVFMTDALREISRQAPQVTFELKPINRRATEALENGTLDFLIVMDVFSLRSHPKMTLFDDSHICIAWARNSQVGAELSLQQYLRLRHVTARIGEAQNPNFEEHFLGRLKVKKKVSVVTPGFSVIPELVVGTNWLGYMPTRLARRYAKLFPLKLVKLVCSPDRIPPLVEVLQWHKSHDRDPAYSWFREKLRTQAARLSNV